MWPFGEQSLWILHHLPICPFTIHFTSALMAFTSNSTIFHVPTNRTIVKIWEVGRNDNWDWSSNLKFNGESVWEREKTSNRKCILSFFEWLIRLNIISMVQRETMSPSCNLSSGCNKKRTKEKLKFAMTNLDRFIVQIKFKVVLSEVLLAEQWLTSTLTYQSLQSTQLPLNPD